MIQNTTDNNNVSIVTSTLPVLNVKMWIVQVLVVFFLYVNCLMLFTFFKKEAFRTTTRYILFAQTLLVDSFFLVLIDIVILLTYFYDLVPVGLCILLCVFIEILTNTTPMSITAMCLERYIAICMPLRHADISTTSRLIKGILIIWALGSFYAFIDLCILVAFTSASFYTEKTKCSYDIILQKEWQTQMRIIHCQVDFLIMGVILVFCYIQIMKAAKSASVDNKKSSSKGTKTLLLHSLQLLLCLIELWCPFIEMSVLHINLQMFISVRYFNFIAFTLASRCLSPLVYGLRDGKFSVALKYYASFQLNKPISPVCVET